MRYNTETDQWSMIPQTYCAYDQAVAFELDGRITILNGVVFGEDRFDVVKNDWSLDCTLPPKGSDLEPICAFKMVS
jgi:hypothetical protein